MGTIKPVDVAKTAAYAAYNVGLSIPIGLARIAVSLYYLGKQAIFSQAYNGVLSAHKEQTRSRADERLEQDVARHQERSKAVTDAQIALSRAKTAKNKAQGWKATAAAAAKVKATELALAKAKAAAAVGERVDDVLEDFNALGDKIESVAVRAQVGANRQVRLASKDEWISQLVRGVLELIPLMGTAYVTYHDFKGKKVKKVDTFGWNEFNNIHQAQQQIDSLFDHSDVVFD